MRRSALIVGPLFVVALLAGCNQGDDNNPGDDSGKSKSKGSDFGGNSGKSGDDLASCIVGDWEADAETLAAMDLDNLATEGVDMTVDTVFTFEKSGEFDWKFDVSGSGTEQGMSYSVNMNIDMIGTWKVSGTDQVDMTLDDATGTATIDVAGQKQTQDLPESALGVTDAGTGTSKVACSSTKLELINGSETVGLTRK